MCFIIKYIFSSTRPRLIPKGILLPKQIVLIQFYIKLIGWFNGLSRLMMKYATTSRQGICKRPMVMYEPWCAGFLNWVFSATVVSNSSGVLELIVRLTLFWDLLLGHTTSTSSSRRVAGASSFWLAKPERTWGLSAAAEHRTAPSLRVNSFSYCVDYPSRVSEELPTTNLRLNIWVESLHLFPHSAFARWLSCCGKDRKHRRSFI